jgi:hypothetical protein
MKPTHDLHANSHISGHESSGINSRGSFVLEYHCWPLPTCQETATTCRETLMPCIMCKCLEWTGVMSHGDPNSDPNPAYPKWLRHGWIYSRYMFRILFLRCHFRITDDMSVVMRLPFIYPEARMASEALDQSITAIEYLVPILMIGLHAKPLRRLLSTMLDILSQHSTLPNSNA